MPAFGSKLKSGHSRPRSTPIHAFLVDAGTGSASRKLTGSTAGRLLSRHRPRGKRKKQGSSYAVQLGQVDEAGEGKTGEDRHRRRRCFDLVGDKMRVSERRACRVLGRHRSTQRRVPCGRPDEGRLVADMIELARQYGRYGYRRIAVMLRDAGWSVSDGRVERLWDREGLEVPQKQSRKGRPWLDDKSRVRLRPEYCNRVWSHDFLHHRTENGKAS